MRLLVCGSRTWIDREAIWRRLDVIHKPLTYNGVPMGGYITLLIHGAARGVDAFADEWAETFIVPRWPFPALWHRPVDGCEGMTLYDKAAGPKRNQRMLDEGKPDRVLAFRMNGESRGTDDMVRRATRAGIPVEVVLETPA